MTFMEKSALELLLKYGVHRFPIDAADMARKLHYNLVDYQKGAALIASAGLESMCIYDGFSAKIGEKYYIFLKDSLTREKKNWITAHEIAHIRHHLVSNGLIGHSTNGKENQLLEQEAEVFAKSLLAPLYALSNMKIVEPADIERITGLDLDKAREVFLDLSEYEAKREELLLQSQVSKQFRFNRRGWRCARWSLLLLCLCLLAISGLLFIHGERSVPPTERQLQPIAAASLPEQEVEGLSTSDTAPAQICFWTAGGEVYHLYPDCQALKQVTDALYSGPVEEAQDAKSRICRFCERRAQQPSQDEEDSSP